MWHESKTEKGKPFLKKKHCSIRHFTSVLTTARKQREKSWQDVPVNLSENIPTKAETMKNKSSISLLGMLSYID